MSKLKVREAFLKAQQAQYESTQPKEGKHTVIEINDDDDKDESMDVDTMSSIPPVLRTAITTFDPPSQPSSSQPLPPQPTPLEKREKILYQQQQRLLLLRHSCECEAPPGQCMKTQHCHMMKELWIHMRECKNEHCATPHCISSRYVMTHYKKCKDEKCIVCAPVRNAKVV